MAAKPSNNLFRGAGRNALDLPVAGLAALAAAFAAFAVPQDLLSRAVVATGLPSLLSAAQPPLGLTARVALAVGGAVIVFGLVFLLLRLFDRSGMRAERDANPSDAPRVRRRDGHPDAPAPRPISAARDFGEPAPPSPPPPSWLAEAEPEAVRPASAPSWLAEAEAEAAVPAPESDPSEARPASLAELIERLEHGLSRRRARPVPASPAPAAAAPQVFPEPGDDRLQSAIDSLQRLAARQS